MRTFVIHYPKLVDRKQALLKQLEDLNIEAEWVEHWNKDDPFVSHVKELTKSPLPLGHLSAFLKRLWVYKKMVDENIQEAIIFEDDVVIHP
jgi:glycosyl transferase family 25